MFLEIFPLLIVFCLILVIVYYRPYLHARHDQPLHRHDQDQEHDDHEPQHSGTESKKKLGKKKLKHRERKEQARRYQEYLESVKQDQLLREELKQEDRERRLAKTIKSRKRQDALEIQELNQRIQARLAQEQLEREKELQEQQRLSDLVMKVKEYIIKKRSITSQDLINTFSIDQDMLDDILKETRSIIKFDNVYIYLDDDHLDRVYNFILEKGVVDQSDILNFINN